MVCNCLEAPPGNMGEYQYTELYYILSTAYTAFQAARIESAHKLDSTTFGVKPTVVIHTGNWGTGAYG